MRQKFQPFRSRRTRWKIKVNHLFSNKLWIFEAFLKIEIFLFFSKLFQTKKDHAFQIYLSGLCSSEKSQSTLDKEESGKKSKTPTSPKQKPDKKTAPRKSSQTMNNPSMGALGDELSAHFVSNFYASFVQSLISKALCMAASEITKKQTFEHIAELSLNVKF